MPTWRLTFSIKVATSGQALKPGEWKRQKYINLRMPEREAENRGVRKGN